MWQLFSKTVESATASLAAVTLEKNGNSHLLGLKFSMKMASSSPSAQSTIRVTELGTYLVLGTRDTEQSLVSEDCEIHNVPDDADIVL